MFPLPHLRSGFRRRGQSNPTSPVLEQHQQTLWESSAFHEHPHSAQDVSPRPDSRPDSSNSFHIPPTLPPITRVTSSDSQANFGAQEDETSQVYLPVPVRSQLRDDDMGFLGGVALANHRRTMQQASGQENTATDRGPPQPRSRVPPPPINTGIPYQRPAPLPNIQTKAGSSFVTPTDLHQLSAEPKGKRPSGTRLVSEPAALAHQLQALEISKGRRGLSSLKDRFLMKRKAAPVTPELGPVSPRLQHDIGLDYDPRIVGRRFHDFDNPNRKKPVPQQQTAHGQPASPVDQSNEWHTFPLSSDPRNIDPSTQHPERNDPDAAALGLLRGDAAFTVAHLATVADSDQSVKYQHKRRQSSLDKVLPKEPLSLQREAGRDPSEQTPAVSRRGSSALPRSTSCGRTALSRNVSLSDPAKTDSAISAIPKHMKSTSSRFSFDMVGAAKQEKLLEEKHRQRQIEKGADDSDFAAKDRDSRFDDFDHDDYDYDAMMDDDGLEERIPGVNADAEVDDYPEEEIPGVNADAAHDYYLEEDVPEEQDPDNDQENFSGFVFQRSNPATAVTSPSPPDMLPTPRDPTGKVIGFAVTKDITPDLAQDPSPLYQTSFAAVGTHSNLSEGLGIQGLDGAHRPVYDNSPYEDNHAVPFVNVPATLPPANDDLYYDEDFIDDDLRDELNFEPHGPAFDESLFDIDDTDKYGRPIPGAFAQAKSMMTAQQPASNRQSDETSRMSGKSAASGSTAHTSLEAGLQPVLAVVDTKGTGLEFPQQSERRSSVVPAPSSELAYQAALAEAAHKAAASGKFRRSSSPVAPDPHLTVTSPTDSTESHSHSHPENGLDLDDEPRGLEDDYDFDDDVIAEANAEALANDSDGWYGREFGFYSAPVAIPSHGHGHHGTAALDSSPKPLSAENLFQYANGGYFGPAGGVIRSASGRMVSREPNLTPITERSEYSNRNSIMSFSNIPGITTNNITTTPGGGGGSGPRELQSPGLAELAMMDDGDANMSMSALLRLRSKTFGSAKGPSLPSSSPEGSPRSEFSPGFGGGGGTGATSPWGGAAAAAGYSASHMRKNSSFSMRSATTTTTTTSDGGSGAGSPTLTMSGPPLLSPSGGGVGLAPSVFAQGQYPSTTSPVLPGLSFPPVMEEEDFVRMLPYGDAVAVSTATAAAALGQGHTQVPRHGDAPPLGLLPGETAYGGPACADDVRAPPPPMSPALISSPTLLHGLAQGQGQQQQHHQYSKRPGIGHRHKGSADSISYVKEAEESGETRWVMERRRTAETGEVEVLEREVVRGGI